MFNIILDLFKLADEYMDDDLKIKSIEVMTKELTVEKVVDLYPFACKFPDTEVSDKWLNDALGTKKPYLW